MTGWRDLDKTWHDTSVDYCDVCGNLLIRRYFGFTGDDGHLLRACREDDQRLYRKLRRHGSAVAGGADEEDREGDDGRPPH